MLRRLIKYRGWKVWMSYNMHISLLALFYILITENLKRPLDSLVLISSLGFYFMYTFLINDYIDMPYDILAGKSRIIHELSRSKFLILILVVVFLSVLHLIYLREIRFILVYILAYIFSTFYSAPPLRFKSRGLSGIIVDSLVEKTFPVLSIFTFFNIYTIDTILFLVISFSMGIVEIIMHQILDYESDLKSDVHTFVVNIGKDKAIKIFNAFINPFSGILIVFLIYFIIFKISYSVIIIFLSIIAYYAISLFILKNREDKIFPLYMSCLFLLMLNILPIFFGIYLIIKSISYIGILLVAIFSQYYIFKYRINAVRTKGVQHKEIIVDG